MKLALAGWKSWRIDAAGVAACAAMTLGVYLAGVRPVLQEHDDLAARQEQLHDRQAKAARAAAQLAGIEGKLRQARQTLADKPVQLEPASNVNLRLGQLSSLASECGLKVDEIQPARHLPGEHYHTVPVLLAGSGSYQACTMFLHRLGKAFADTAVVKVELTGTAGESSGASLFRLDLHWHAAASPPAQGG